GAVLEQVDAGAELDDVYDLAGEVHGEDLAAVGDKERRRVVLVRTDDIQQLIDGVAGPHVRGTDDRQCAARPLGRIRSRRRRTIRETRDDAVLVDGEPRPARDFVTTTDRTRTGVSQHAHGRRRAVK